MMQMRGFYSLKKQFVSIIVLSVAMVGSLAAAETNPFEDQLKNFDRDDIHSIHKKLYTKEGRHELTLTTGGIFNDNGYVLTGLQYTYHLFENLGIEAVNGGWGFQIGDDDKMYFYQASAIFSPLYGKVSLFTWAVANFDIYMVGGGGFVKYEGRFDGTGFMGNVGVGQRFFINEYLSAKVEFRDYFYNAKRAGDSEIQHNFSLVGGLSVLIPFRQKY